MILLEDEAILLDCNNYSPGKYIISCLSKHHGKIKGFSRTPSSIPGCICNMRWSARLINQLGSIKTDVIRPSPISQNWQHILTISIISSIISLASRFIPEHNPDSVDYYTLLDTIHGEVTGNDMIEWEIYLCKKYLNINYSVMQLNSNLYEHIKKFPELNTRSRIDLQKILHLLNQ